MFEQKPTKKKRQHSTNKLEDTNTHRHTTRSSTSTHKQEEQTHTHTGKKNNQNNHTDKQIRKTIANKHTQTTGRRIKHTDTHTHARR